MAYSPLGSPDSYSGKLVGPILLNDPTVEEVAAEMGCTPAQTLIRWGIQKVLIEALVSDVQNEM